MTKEFEEQIDNVLKQYGIDKETAIRIFFRKCVQRGKIPFKLPKILVVDEDGCYLDRESVEAIEEANTHKLKSCNSVDDMFKEILC
jgi:addiction module RelB/DinJ family antitoxin